MNDKVYIYSIVNEANGKIFFGKSTNVRGQMVVHKHFARLRSGTHENRVLQNDFNKVGEAEFRSYQNETVELTERELDAGRDLGKKVESRWDEYMRISRCEMPSHGYNLSAANQERTMRILDQQEALRKRMAELSQELVETMNQVETIVMTKDGENTYFANVQEAAEAVGSKSLKPIEMALKNGNEYKGATWSHA